MTEAQKTTEAPAPRLTVAAQYWMRRKGTVKRFKHNEGPCIGNRWS